MQELSEISIVIPAFNEQEHISNTVENIIGYCRNNFKEWEIILVNDGSADDTLNIAKSLVKANNRINVISNAKRMGKGFSLRRGLGSAQYRYIFFTDADLSFPIEQINKLLKGIDEDGFDIVIGSRVLTYPKIALDRFLYRRIMGRIFNILVKVLMGLKFNDTQSGFKLFKKKSIERILPKMTINGFSFDVELLLIAMKSGFKVCEVRVISKNFSRSKVNLFLDPFKMLVGLFRIKYNDLVGKYE